MALQRRGSLIIVLVVALSMFELAVSTKNWTDTAGNWSRTEGNWGYWHKNYSTQGSRRIVVGGSENWHFGYNYTEWALKNGPFYLNDTLGIHLLSFAFLQVCVCVCNHRCSPWRTERGATLDIGSSGSSDFKKKNDHTFMHNFSKNLNLIP